MAHLINRDSSTNAQKFSSLAESCTTDALSELGIATTLYHEAPPERIEAARQQYEQALRVFKAGA